MAMMAPASSRSLVGSRYDQPREMEAKVASKKKPARRGNRQSTGEAFLKSTIRTIGNSLGREISRNLMGVLFGKK
jgi:uncharacterized protein